MFYFKKGQFAQEFFTMLEQILKNYRSISTEIFPNSRPTSLRTSHVFPACIKMLGIEDSVYDKNNVFKYIDMKLSCLNAKTLKWDEDLGHWGDITNLYIENFNQYYPIHYRNAEIHTL